jgi:hypothetical protein
MWDIDPMQLQPILWKTGHAKGSSHTREGRSKKEIKQVNMVNVLSTRMNIGFKGIFGIIIRRGQKYKEKK